ncbi:MAG: hypothetical protein AAF722_07425 [Cyanobacteria bacterium P01_C01_bin.70]
MLANSTIIFTLWLSRFANAGGLVQKTAIAFHQQRSPVFRTSMK